MLSESAVEELRQTVVGALSECSRASLGIDDPLVADHVLRAVLGIVEPMSAKAEVDRILDRLKQKAERPA